MFSGVVTLIPTNQNVWDESCNEQRNKHGTVQGTHLSPMSHGHQGMTQKANAPHHALLPDPIAQYCS